MRDAAARFLTHMQLDRDQSPETVRAYASDLSDLIAFLAQRNGGEPLPPADVDARMASEVRDAMAGIDDVLDTRQRIRFRVFEEQMERRKFDLLMRARQANRARTP